MWVAARLRLAKNNPRFVDEPLPVRGVIDLARAADMEAYIQVEMRGCGDTVVEQMLGGKPTAVPERYAQVSAIKMLLLGIPQILIWGRRDDHVPSPQ